MNVSFLVNEILTYGPDGWSPENENLKGTEESVVEWAKRLRARGHGVRVYKNGPSGIWDDVEYLGREQYVQVPPGITINLKSSDTPPRQPTLYLTNETNASALDLSAYQAVIWPSRWARDNIPVNNKTEVLPHGYDRDRIKPGKKITNQCLYASSRDRGLSDLLAVWPEVVRCVPTARLIVTYGGPPVHGPNVLDLGEVDRETMDDLYATSDLWVHPCSGGELFGMAGINAQVAECVPLYFPTMALSETVRAGVRTTKEKLAGDLISLLGSEDHKRAIRQELQAKHFVDWDESTDILEKLIVKYGRDGGCAARVTGSTTTC